MCDKNPPPETWTLIYSIICIVLGVILSVVFIYFGLEEQEKVDNLKPFMEIAYAVGYNPYQKQYRKSRAIAAVCFAGFVCAVFYLFAGIFMLIGMKIVSASKDQ